MNIPSLNRRGYERSSVVKHAQAMGIAEPFVKLDNDETVLLRRSITRGQ